MRKHAISFTGCESRTKQSFKTECDINEIMKKFQKSGAITHYASHAPSYGDTTGPQLAEAMNIVADAETMFEELPSAIRKKFANDPERFLEFVQDPNNLEEMRELGLANKAQAPNASEGGTNPPKTTTDTKKPKTEEAPPPQ